MCRALRDFWGGEHFLPQFLQGADLQQKDPALGTPDLGTVSAMHLHTCVTRQGETLVLRVAQPPEVSANGP